MHSKFDSPVQVVGDAVNAGGPLEWAQGETWAIVMVTVTQKDEKIAGRPSRASRRGRHGGRSS